MKQYIETYFQSERSESLVFVALGVLAVLLAGWFWFSARPEFYRGMAWPLLLVGIIQLVVGGTVYVRSPKDIVTVSEMTASAPEKIKSVEIPRMETVMKNFVIYRYVEIALMILGLAFIMINKDINFWKGVGAGLFAQATLMLIADYFAEKRGKVYLQQLMDFLGN
jgi:hypothetical protein